jgi:hypothetical protein
MNFYAIRAIYLFEFGTHLAHAVAEYCHPPVISTSLCFPVVFGRPLALADPGVGRQLRRVYRAR